MYNHGQIADKVVYDIQHNTKTLIASTALSFLYTSDATLYGVIIYGSDFEKYIQNQLPEIIKDYKETISNSHSNSDSQPASVSVFQIKLSDQIHILFELTATSVRKLPIALTIFNSASNTRTDFHIETQPDTSVEIELLKDYVDLTSDETDVHTIINDFIQESDRQRAYYEKEETQPGYYLKTLPRFLDIAIEAHPMYDDNQVENPIKLPELPKAIQDYMLSYL